jgi:hypothetical protein
MSLPEFYQQISRRLRDQFGKGVRDVGGIVGGRDNPICRHGSWLIFDLDQSKVS